MAKLYRNIDIQKADMLYSDLWMNSTQAEMDFYPKEFLEIMKEKDRIITIREEDIQFDYKEFDFGYVRLYEEVECKFHFTNKSQYRFVIHSVLTTCGCTVPSWNKLPIMPNSHDSISVKFKSSSKGLNQKTIVIDGNCDKKIRLRIKAMVIDTPD